MKISFLGIPSGAEPVYLQLSIEKEKAFVQTQNSETLQLRAKTDKRKITAKFREKM